MAATEGLTFFGKLKVLASGKKEELDELYQLIEYAVQDGTVTDDELSGIKRHLAESGLSDEHYQRITAQVFEKITSQYTADHRLTPKEKSSIGQIAHALELPASLVEKIFSQNELYFLLHEVETAPFDQIPALNDSGVILKPGEIDYISFAASMLEERIVNRTSRGKYGGVNVRVMKGVSFHVGQTRGRLVIERGMVPISSGNFTVTNERLIFSGDRKSVNAPLSRLLAVEFFADGVRFSVTNRQLPVTIRFHTKAAAEVVGVYISRVINR